jgi:hypothetical protein
LFWDVLRAMMPINRLAIFEEFEIEI